LLGNLNFETTEHDIRSLFASYGTVDRINLVTDRETGKSKGVGFVEMGNDSDGNRAIAELNCQELDGRSLTINESRPKPEGSGARGRY
jgi:cold-inducible RNA-binding protein